MKNYTQIHRQASVIADAAQATKGGPYIAANMIMARRRTKGADAALLAGLVTAALVERGQVAAAEQLTKELALLAVED